MKRMIPMALAGMFFATAAFAQVDQTTTPEQDTSTPAVTDTIPAQQNQETTFPAATTPPATDTESTPTLNEPTKTDVQNQVDTQNETTTPPAMKTEDTTDTGTPPAGNAF